MKLIERFYSWLFSFFNIDSDSLVPDMGHLKVLNREQTGEILDGMDKKALVALGVRCGLTISMRNNKPKIINTLLDSVTGSELLRNIEQ